MLYPDLATVYPCNFKCTTLGVFGGLDLHGLEPDVKWTNLAVTAETGATSLTLETPVTWSAGDEILLTTTDRNPWHTETFRLTQVAGTVLTLNSSVQYRHLGTFNFR